MFCTKCGSELPEGVKFCTKCGSPVQDKNSVQAGSGESISSNVAVKQAPRKEISKNKSEGKFPVLPVVIAILAVLLVVLVALVVVKKDDIGEMLHDRFGIDFLYSGDDDDDDDDLNHRIYDEEEESSDEASIETTLAEVVEEEAEDTDTMSVAKWCEAYSDYLSAGEYTTYQGALIYVNEDEIPEMVLIGDCEAVGNLIVTYDGEKIDELQTARLYFEYEERGNRLCNSDGNSGYYYDSVYAIEDGRWVSKASGTYNMIDYESEELEYQWDGRTVSADEYSGLLEDVFSSKDAKVVREGTNYNQFFTSLINENPIITESSDVYFTDTKDIHDYEIVRGDVTWYEAQENALNKGGYLVHINSKEEYDRIVELIENEGLHDGIFWIGGTRTSYFENEYTWAYKDNTYKKCTEILEKNPEYDEFWLNGEPSYTGEDANGITTDEEYLDMFYSKKQGRFVWNDVPSDIISIVPSYAGKVAYIIEFE